MNYVGDFEEISDEMFDDIKASALVVWSKYEQPYRGEKMAYVVKIANICDNYLTLIGMMDVHNKAELFTLVKPCTRAFLDRIYSKYWAV